ncbi:longevity assurance factor 1 lag1 [Anaeramoeba flamelloides]|uniref:Longevity assurance factor 1 lag1 n=1 Tax=Anaeramoeba flamelloides TaxID=1746091 RepID=A0AAV7ZMB5_9EUKA|nr:longevity assurance factor 1 lag1 [Anaeramoeba flamelloides]
MNKEMSLDYTNLFFYKQKSGLYKYGPLDFVTLSVIVLIVWLLKLAVDRVTDIFLYRVSKSKHLKFKTLTFQGFFRIICIIVLVYSFYSRGLLKFALFPWIDLKFLEKYPTSDFTFAGKFIYMFELSYVFVMAPLVPKLESGKGVYLMLLHHVVTASTVIFSYLGYQNLYGETIFFVNDLGVTLLYISKTVNYLNYEKIAHKLLLVLAFIWIPTRLTAYPCHAISGIVLGRLDFEPGFKRVLHYIFTAIPLVTLEYMQILWTILITKMIIRLFKTGRVDGDIRSDNEKHKKTKKETKLKIKKVK